MGVINLSPDSWYRESVCLTAESAIRRGRVLREQGAEIIDVGAESTLPQAARVGEAAQTTKLLPVIKGLRESGILVSIETYEPAVARVCLEAGANILNLTGSDCSDELFHLVAAHDAAVLLCYVQGKNVREVGDFEFSADPTETMGFGRTQFVGCAGILTPGGAQRDLPAIGSTSTSRPNEAPPFRDSSRKTPRPFAFHQAT